VWWLDRRATAHPSRQPTSRILATVSPDTITTILLFAAGALLLAGVDDGVYVVLPAVVAAITGGVASAWLFLTRITT
jgi:predicted anti-sigma-YlaC factor YlaD